MFRIVQLWCVHTEYTRRSLCGLVLLVVELLFLCRYGGYSDHVQTRVEKHQTEGSTPQVELKAVHLKDVL